ncbi:MAG: CHAT domain-containing protein [Cyanobacteria bacterium SZAS TMP-1]|nr:CHAT domain-containing protein [Cyanobacteria bacterium SZAS TMP-1]
MAPLAAFGRDMNLLAAAPPSKTQVKTYGEGINNVPNSGGDYANDKSKGSEAIIKQLQQLTDLQQTPQSIEKLNELDKKGEEFYKQHLYSQALTNWQEEYGMSLDLKYAEGQGRALTNMCRIYVDQGQWIKAKYLGENAVEVLAGVHNERSLAKARVALGQAYFGLDNPVWAVQQLDAALKVLTGTNMTDPAEASSVMYLCGQLCIKFNKPKEAIRFFQQGATYSMQMNDYPRVISVRSAVVGSMIEMGWLVAALEEANNMVSQAKAIKTDTNIYLIPALECLANAQYAANEFAAAKQTYEQCYGLLPKIPAKSFGDVARANLDEGYGFVLSATGDQEQARQYMLKALRVFTAKSDSYSEAQVLNALGVIEVTDGQPGKALTYFQQALDFISVLNPKLPKLNALILQNMAVAEYRTGAFRSAKNHLDGALTVLSKAGDSVLQCRLKESLAEVDFKSADLTGAQTKVMKAIEMADKIKDDACLWRAHTLLAKIQIAQGTLEPVKESLKSALSYFRSPQAGDFSSADSLQFPTTREDMGDSLVALMASQGMTEDALLAAEQLKEEGFITEWLRRGGQVKPEDRDVYGELVTQRVHIHAAEVGANPSALQKEWQSWLERFRGLIKTNRALARLIAPVPTLPSEIIAAVQRDNATALEYLVGPEASMVFTIDSQGRISSTSLSVNRARLKSQVSALLSGATKGGDSSSSESERQNLKLLYSELLPPSVRQFLPKTSEQMIVIIPDGALFNLPFAALIDERGKFFVENHLLTMASSMSVLVDNAPKSQDDLSVIVASMGGASDSGESVQIANVVGPDRITTLNGKDAAITNLEEQAKGKSVVHICARLPLIESNPLRSVLPIFSDKGDASKNVTAGRLFGTSMPSDLIVWSATSVNNKDVRGNAVKVFSRGLNYVGARNVLMSLWSQPDAQRIEELVNFYKGKQAGLNPAQSLRKAQLVGLSRDPSPSSWAAYQLLGPGY